MKRRREGEGEGEEGSFFFLLHSRARFLSFSRPRWRALASSWPQLQRTRCYCCYECTYTCAINQFKYTCTFVDGKIVIPTPLDGHTSWLSVSLCRLQFRKSTVTLVCDDFLLADKVSLITPTPSGILTVWTTIKYIPICIQLRWRCSCWRGGAFLSGRARERARGEGEGEGRMLHA